MISQMFFQLSLVLTLALISEGSLPLLPGLRRCSIKLPPDQLSECATKSANDGVSIIIRGNRQYKIPVLDPLKIDKMIIDQGQGSVGLNLVLIDAVVTGFKNLVINNASMDMSTKTVSYDAFVPKLEILSKYDISGRILVLPIVGQGTCNFTLKNINVKYMYDFTFDKAKDGEYYLTPKPYKFFDFTTTRLYLKLDNLFNGDKLIGDNTNLFLNENWEDVLQSVKPIFLETISQIIQTTQINVFSAVTFKDAFLDTEDFKFN